MAWYDTGTVNVTLNSATVTGSGTQWVAGARQGEAFVGPDGRLYEVLNIASNTSLTLTKPYRGATASDQQYALAPMQGYTKELADRAAQLIDRFGAAVGLAEGAVQKAEMMAATNLFNTSGRLGLIRGAFGIGGEVDWRTGPIDPRGPPSTFFSMGSIRGFADGSSATANKGLGIPALGSSAAYGVLVIDAQYKDASGARGIQRQFTCLSGRRFLSGAESGTTWGAWVEVLNTSGNLAGLASPAAARTNLGLKSAALADLIGDVGTGAVMQSGSNSNGQWYRFQSGLQICTIDWFNMGWGNVPVYNIYGSSQKIWSYPATFVPGTRPSLGAFVAHGWSDCWISGAPNGVDSTAAAFRLLALAGAAHDVYASLVAFGRWK